MEKLIKQFYQVNSLELLDYKKLPVVPFLQKDYGEANDCTLVSIASILYYLKKGTVEENYSKIEKIAKKYFYNGKTYGTLPIFIKQIFQTIANRKAKSIYLKSIGFLFSQIQEQIDKNNPVILNLMDDGIGKYKNHSVVIIGYAVYKINNNKIIPILLINDNWSKETQYILYDKLSTISSIVYLK